MPKSRKKKSPKRVLALPDLEQSKAAVLNSLTSKSGQRSYDHAITDFVSGTAQNRASHSIAPLSSDTGSISNRNSTRRQRSICAWRSAGRLRGRRFRTAQSRIGGRDPHYPDLERATMVSSSQRRSV